LVALNSDEQPKENCCARQFGNDPAIAPAAMVAFDQSQRRQEQRAGEASDAGQIEPHRAGVFRGLDHLHDQGDQGDADRKIDIEGPFPTEALCDETAEPQNAKARARASPWKACDSVASAELSCIAAPAPWSARAAISTVRFGAAPHRKDAKVNTDNPVISSRLRPKRSASAPAGISSEAKLSM